MGSAERVDLHTSGLAVPVLLWASGLVVAFALYEARWGPGVGALPWITAGSVLFALFLVRSVLPSLVLHVASSSFAFSLTAGLVAYYAYPGLPWMEALSTVLASLRHWAWSVSAGVPVEDPIPFVFALGYSLWMVEHFSTWLVYREGKAWWAAAGPAVVLLASTYYAQKPATGYVVIYAFCALLLIVRVSCQGLMRDWRITGIPHDHTFGEDFLLDSLYIVAAMVMIAWLLPPAALEQKASELWLHFERPWRALQQRWNTAFATTGGRGSSEPAISIYGESLALGGPVKLAAQPVLAVRVTYPVQRLQGMIFDLYDGRQWWASAPAVGLMDPLDYPTAEAFLERRFVEQEVTVLHQTRTLHAAPTPKWFSIPAKTVHLRFGPEPGLVQLDLYSATARQELRPGDSYAAISAVSEADKPSLRAAARFYPRWLPQAYLELPRTLPSRVTELAARITEAKGNAYDKAEALEAYLRTLRYNESVAAPPAGWDAVDYFLFESRQGYCNYFASAMAVMARSLGIPARVVAGYVLGPYDEQTGRYIVLGSGAHAWPQLFFPGYGWVDFEPTPSQPLLQRADAEPAQSEPAQLATPAGSDERPWQEPLPEEMELYQASTAPARPAAWSLWLRPVLGSLACALALAGSLAIGYYGPRRRLSLPERLFADLVLAVRLVGLRPLPQETALEFGARVERLIPAAAEELRELLAAFCRARYGGGWQGPQASQALADAWLKVLAALARAAFSPMRGR